MINFEYKEGKALQNIASQFVRCLSCQATLTQELAVQNYSECIVLSQYEPEDKQGLMVQYCELLKLIDISDPNQPKGGQDGEEQTHNNMYEFIDACENIAKKKQKYKLSERIQYFRKKLEGEVQNIQVKEALQWTRMNEADEAGQTKNNQMEWFGVDDSKLDPKQRAQKQEQTIRDTDTAVYELIKQAETKLHQRILQKFNLLLIDNEIKRCLMPQIQSRIDYFKNSLIS